MNFLQLYAQLRMQNSILQFIVVLTSLALSHFVGHWFSLVATMFGMLYFCFCLIGFELTAKDVEIDQITPPERSDSQKRLQFVKILLDWALMALSMLTVILTSIAMVLDYVP